MTHISLDLETLSTASDAAIIQIGAVDVFNPHNTFAAYIDPLQAKGHVSLETMQWWDTQDPDLRDRVMGGKETHVTALESFTNWCGELSQWNLSSIHLWANGADFDLPILRNAYERFTSYPFDFRKHRCYRTLLTLASHTRTPSALPHSALSDAMAQAIDIGQVLKKL